MYFKLMAVVVFKDWKFFKKLGEVVVFSLKKVI